MSSTLLACPELVTWRAIASGMLPPQTSSALLHLRDCPRCQSQARQALGQRDPLAYLLDTIGPPEAAADAELRQTLGQLRPANAPESPGAVAVSPPRTSRYEAWIISLAAGLVLALIITLVYFQSR